ncbi:hypothetical protein [Ethanoligenens harbinense]|uniref:Uncharacterized protein n=1 Tax=Ethanoligenens harbinense (strain DSM 18485 / JCM 12961 / CGMCC 1.5033 / YUAN-3) TaxID=663278 RepID=E6U4C6_ETHHY|nr:hypothetical protein [Ethanoligenens harbinense]ADU27733.1 hypothetical protein Ethha_2218 [Ethanoligenens harbinense YUAN-3]AVQ96762.1 hypothetical protein CXQ68_11420 [Ethanoligenens harbinense YUAN-3]AYF39424.1 hypothetical protein CXP51_11315 [Ethanoligenens harbinense]AYF42248.1 hypothetical protein CN246_11860 [Ethanoligenens harbinense]QCN93004.1 hypothetical protein DRA42_11455 [Ethanoligenens harbinense]
MKGKTVWKSKPFQVIVAGIAIMALLAGAASAQTIPTDQMVTLPNGLSVDKWMLQSDGKTVADCLGQTFSQYGNKKMQEMINLVWVDPYATSSDNANDRFKEALAGADPAINESAMHTGGYTSYLNNILFQQKPDDGNTAFADKSWYNQNIHHFRTFGAVNYQNAWYITVAASTESFDWLKLSHEWTSFNTARDMLVGALLNSKIDPGFTQLANLNLQNQISAGDPNLSTGDFDGVTAYIQAPENIDMNQ